MRKNVVLVLSSLFLLSNLFAQKADARQMKVSSPNGAPALALVSLAEKNPENYTYVAAETIAAEFAGEKADFIIAPVNAGAKLYKMGKSRYKLAAVVTWGNLYFASQKKDFKVTDINNSEITIFGENTINASVALAALEKNKISAKKVNYLGSAAATQNLLLTNPSAIVLTAEPALTAAKMKNAGITAWSVNELYKKTSGFDGYAQAGLFVRADTAEKHPQEVKEFLALAEESLAKCSSDLASTAKAAVKMGILPNAKIAEKAIPNCALRYMPASKAKKQVEATAEIDLKQFGGSLPAADFYYVQ